VLDHGTELLQAAGRARLPVGKQRRRIVWQKGFGLDGPKPILAGLIDEAAGMQGAAPPRDELYKPRAARSAKARAKFIRAEAYGPSSGPFTVFVANISSETANIGCPTICRYCQNRN